MAKKKPNPKPTVDDCCIICGKPYAMTHEVMFGNGNARLSQDYGLTVKLCYEHHQHHKTGVHHNRELDLKLKRMGQQKFIDNYPDLDFCTIFQCKNYL